MNNTFNLIDEGWIPVSDRGLVSLRTLFSDPHCANLGGNPVQKLALFKLLLAIAQAASTPNNSEEWAELSTEALAEKCLAYLDHWYDRFFLYGDKPFLQMPVISAAKIASFGSLQPHISTGNTTVLLESQASVALNNAEKALLLLVQMGFPLGGKKTDNSVVLTENYTGKKNDKGKPSTSKPGPSVMHMGLLHSHLLGTNVRETLFLNLLTHEQVNDAKMYPEGLGVAPWEEMPIGENCTAAKKLSQSLLGRLIPLSRFCLLATEGVHYSEGINHAGHKEGIVDPTVTVDFSGKDPRVKWCDPEKRPWRELTAFLDFLASDRGSGFENLHLRYGIARARTAVPCFDIYSGGLRVSANAGEQYVSGSDDFVESFVTLQSDQIGTRWLADLKTEMTSLEDLSKRVFACVKAYHKEFEPKVKEGKPKKGRADGIAAQASNIFWQFAERDFQSLIDSCDTSVERLLIVRRRFGACAQNVYDTLCSKDTARQIDAWAKCRPNISKYQNREA